VIGGQQYLTPRIACQQSEGFIRDPSMSVTPLTYRQREVLQLLTEGRSMKQEAAELQIAARTSLFTSTG
jgi:DNA-binding NarL/FixJ family response regulator